MIRRRYLTAWARYDSKPTVANRTRDRGIDRNPSMQGRRDPLRPDTHRHVEQCQACGIAVDSDLIDHPCFGFHVDCQSAEELEARPALSFCKSSGHLILLPIGAFGFVRAGPSTASRLWRCVNRSAPFVCQSPPMRAQEQRPDPQSVWGQPYRKAMPNCTFLAPGNGFSLLGSESGKAAA